MPTTAQTRRLVELAETFRTTIDEEHIEMSCQVDPDEAEQCEQHRIENDAMLSVINFIANDYQEF